MTNQTKEELRKEFNFKFGYRFMEIAKLADKGDDVGYGKGLAKLQVDIEDYFTSQFDNLINEKIERIANIQVDLCENSQEFKNSVITILKE